MYVDLDFLSISTLIGLLFFCLFITVFFHEFGHYLGFRIFKIKPKFFIVGSSMPVINKLNALFCFKINDTKFIINPIPIGGMVESYYSKNHLTKEQILIVAFGGIFFNILIGTVSIIMYFKYYNSFNNEFIIIFFYMLAFLNFGCLLNLLPFKGTDGWHLLEILLYKRIPFFEKEKEKSFSTASKLTNKKITDNYLIELFEIEKPTE